MTFSTLATVAIGLGCVAVAVALGAGVLVCLGRRRLAERALPAFLLVLAAGVLLSFAAVAESQNDLQHQAEHTLSLASAAERAQLARTGHFTTSVKRLKSLSPGLATEIKVDAATVVVRPGRQQGNITLRASLGPGTVARATLSASSP